MLSAALHRGSDLSSPLQHLPSVVRSFVFYGQPRGCDGIPHCDCDLLFPSDYPKYLPNLPTFFQTMDLIFTCSSTIAYFAG